MKRGWWREALTSWRNPIPWPRVKRPSPWFGPAKSTVLMKGLIATSDYMKQILDKETGLLPEGRIVTHVTVLELPAYLQRHGKLLFVSQYEFKLLPEFTEEPVFLTR